MCSANAEDRYCLRSDGSANNIIRSIDDSWTYDQVKDLGRKLQIFFPSMRVIRY